VSRRRIGLLALVAPLLVVGLVLIVAAFEPDGTTVEECQRLAESGADPVPCYRQALANLAFRDGVPVALERFRDESASVLPLAGGCHPVAHFIGAAGLARAEGDVGGAFAVGDDSCASGYYHGVLEHAFAEVAPTSEALWSASERLCDSPSISGIDYLLEQCFHGIGHGLMLATDYDLPVADTVCGRFESIRAVNSCYLGIFMENFAASYGVASRWVDDADLGAVCSGLGGRWADVAKGACYNTLTYRIAARSGGAPVWDEYLAACRSIDPTYADACFNGFGREVYTRYAAVFSDSFAQMRAICEEADEGAGACIASVAGHASYTEGGGTISSGFCASLEGPVRGRCYGEIGSFLAALEGGLDALPGRCVEIARSDGDYEACLGIGSSTQ
jgi:hypothetical protein